MHYIKLGTENRLMGKNNVQEDIFNKNLNDIPGLDFNSHPTANDSPIFFYW